MEIRIKEELVNNAIFRMDESTAKLDKCLDELSEEELWQRPNEASNSVANLILHMCGNMTQYIIASIGGKVDLRERDLEFSTTSGYNRAKLLQKLHITTKEARDVLLKAEETELLRVRSVQGYQLSGVGNVLHAVEHYAYHTGQIVFWTKWIKDKDLGFYNDINLNAHNE